MKEKSENENARRFDELAKTLGQGLTRRETLRRIGGGLGALLVGSFVGKAWAAGGNSDCAHWCNENFPPGPARGMCTSQAALGTGPCYECGPAAPPGHGPFCGHVCCGPDEVCTDNACVPAAGHNAVDCFCTDGMHYGPFCTNIDCDFSNIQERLDFCNSVCAANGSGSQGGTGCITDDMFSCP